MKANKKIIVSLIAILTICVLIVILGKKNNNNSENTMQEFTEYVPQEEISNEQLRQTLVTLYFKNKETGELMPEARMIDSKILLNNPYAELINLLIQGPKNENLESTIPNGTAVNGVVIEKGIVYVDFSEEFIKQRSNGG